VSARIRGEGDQGLGDPSRGGHGVRMFGNGEDPDDANGSADRDKELLAVSLALFTAVRFTTRDSHTWQIVIWLLFAIFFLVVIVRNLIGRLR
jgi:hypothetical protein